MSLNIKNPAFIIFNKKDKARLLHPSSLINVFIVLLPDIIVPVEK